MVWKFALAMTLVAVVVEGQGGRWPCKKAKAKLHKCRQTGYVLGECSVPEGAGVLAGKKAARCQELEEKYAEKCGGYECVDLDTG